MYERLPAPDSEVVYFGLARGPWSAIAGERIVISWFNGHGRVEPVADEAGIRDLGVAPFLGSPLQPFTERALSRAVSPIQRR